MALFSEANGPLQIVEFTGAPPLAWLAAAAHESGSKRAGLNVSLSLK